MPASKKLSLCIVLLSLLTASLACLGTEIPVAPPPEEENLTEAPPPQSDIPAYISNFASGDTSGWVPITGDWSLIDGQYTQSDPDVMAAKTMFDDFHPDYTDCFTYQLYANVLEGQEGFLVIFPYQGRYVWWNIGGWTNSASKLEYIANDTETYKAGAITYGHWYPIQVTVMADTVAGWIGFEEQWRVSRTADEVTGLPDDGQRGTGLTGFAGLGTWDTAVQFTSVQLIASCEILGAEPININTASHETLATIPGLEWPASQAIVDYRTEHGPFGSLEELINVKGIGPATIEIIAPYVTTR